ncbi:head maturation protease, ClpP-related [Streptomyces mirabilis]|uniref:head maturation protease, ClpP-related n=1 Tax=Streptomyces mirabilis TaxID=68239 RepID=UPI0035E31DFC
MTPRIRNSQAGGSMPLIEAVTRPAHLTARAQVRDASRTWYEIRNATSPDEAELLIYDEIGGWWGATPESVLEELREVTAPNLRVRINSPGGSVFDGVAIANAIRLHPANVTVQIDGLAASIASVIAMAGDRIVMTPQSQLMIHDASGLCMGDAADMTEMAALLDLQSDNIADAYAARAGGTREEWRARMQAESWYLAQEAVDAGLADEVLPSSTKIPAPVPETEPEPDPELDPAMAAHWDLSVFRYAGREQAPAPAPVAAAEPTLVISIADALDEDTMARLRAAVQPQAAEPVVEPEPVAEPEGPAEPEPAAEPIEPAEPPEPDTQPEPAEDDWTAMVSSLIPDDADTWSALVSNLIEPDTSSSAATA